MIGLRPTPSDTAPATNSIAASDPVVSDKARLDSAGVTPNSRTKSGISGWTQYRVAKVENPATNRIRLADR